MGRKTKYCLNYAKGKHLNDKKSPSLCYCSGCYENIKNKYKYIEQQGGPIIGLRAARTLGGGSFGYEATTKDKERNLMAFFYYVMPEIPIERALQLSRQIAASSQHEEFQHQDGSYKKTRVRD